MRKSIELAYDAEKLWNKAKLHVKMHTNLLRGRTVVANAHIKDGGIYVDRKRGKGAVIYNNLIEGSDTALFMETEDFDETLVKWLGENGLGLSD